MQTHTTRLTEKQSQMIRDLDDINEHVAWEFDPDEYRGISTIGFAHIGGIDGRSSFVQMIRSLAREDAVDIVDETLNGDFHIEVGGLQMRLSNGRRGYRLSITNVDDWIEPPEHQRLDVRERLHRLVLDRARYNGYLGDARLHTRMD